MRVFEEGKRRAKSKSYDSPGQYRTRYSGKYIEGFKHYQQN
jgi:hypothetical protein